ncbi:MAG: ComEC/Rec2 family competence protein [Acidobacteria bacterium]|nr:ComEC/Rec2 family competence protein [Acidobacteriota bacterium]
MTSPEPTPTQTYSRHPHLWLASAFAFGAAVGGYFAMIGPVYFAAASVLLASLSFAFRERSIATALLLAAFLSAGAFGYTYEAASLSPVRVKAIYDLGIVPQADPVAVRGTLVGAVESGPTTAVLRIAATELTHRGEAMATEGDVRAFVPVDSDDARGDLERLGLRQGDEVIIECGLDRDERFLNPGVARRPELLDRQGIDAACTLKSPLLIERVAKGGGIAASVLAARGAAIERTAEIFSPQTAGILAAAMFGDRYYLDRETAEIFREGGTFHVLVISGLHITFIAGLLLYFTSRFVRSRVRQAAIVLPAVWIFSFSVGMEKPVTRAALMFSFIIIGRAMGQAGSMLNAAGACSLMLLAWRPSDVFDPSLLLTFASVFGIIATAVPLIEKLRAVGGWRPTREAPFPPSVPSIVRRFCEALYWSEAGWRIESGRNVWRTSLFKRPLVAGGVWERIRPTVRFVFEAVVVSASVQLWLLPLMAIYFHRIPVAGIVLNIWTGGLVAAMGVLAVPALLLGSIADVLAMPFVAAAEAASAAAVWGSRAVLGLGIGGLRMPVFSGAGVAIYFLYLVPVVALAVMLVRWDPFRIKPEPRPRTTVKRSLAAAAALMTLGLGYLIVFTPFSAPEPEDRLRVDVLDVGQGDAALITFPNGETMLIDAGGQVDYRTDAESDEDFEPDRARIGEMVVSEFLWQRGLSHIDHIVASHADSDHLQGLIDVARNFTIGRAYFAAAQSETGESQLLYAILAERGVAVERLSAGEVMEVGGVRVDVLYPGATTPPSLAENDRSLVLLLTYGERRFLFTGDIEAEAERLLLESGTELEADVVKVPHHGSRTSSTEAFVRAVRPRFAVIPVGRRSRFRHPDPQVVERWRAAGAETLTTGSRGTITFETDGQKIEVSVFLK